MRVAAITQPLEHGLGGRDIAAVAQRAEQLGYWMVVLPKHFLIPTTHVDLTGAPKWLAGSARQKLSGRLLKPAGPGAPVVLWMTALSRQVHRGSALTTDRPPAPSNRASCGDARLTDPQRWREQGEAPQ
jgi:hypothetical protein